MQPSFQADEQDGHGGAGERRPNGERGALVALHVLVGAAHG